MSRCPLLIGVLLTCLATGPLDAACEDPIDLGRGPIAFRVPDSYNPAKPTPLLVLLHGYGASAVLQESYLRFLPLAEEFGFLYAYPDGEPDSIGNRFWNATDACCNFFGSSIDHSSYLRNLVQTIRSQCNVDPYRIYFAGHSNGGFMSYRMACDHAGTLAGIASLAGATFADPADCSPSEPVHVLQIHGTQDATIDYAGGSLDGRPSYPGAVSSAETWAGYNSCSLTSETLSPKLDLDISLAGRESTARRWADGCSAGGSAELWTIDRGVHVPDVSRDFRRGVVEHLLARPKCRGREQVKRPRCTATGTLKVKLAKGVPGDRYRVELGGAVVEGQLNARGKATVRIADQPVGEGSATVAWGCGATTSRSYECP